MLLLVLRLKVAIFYLYRTSVYPRGPFSLFLLFKNIKPFSFLSQ